MADLRIANFNLNEKYITNRVSNKRILKLIKERKPSIIMMHNISSLTQEELQRDHYISKQYNVWNSKKKYTTMINKKFPLCYFRFFQLNQNINIPTDVAKMPGSEDGNCLSIVINVGSEFITIINAIIDFSFKYNSKKQIQTLKGILEMFSNQSRENIYKTDRQLISCNFYDSYLTDFCTDSNFTIVCSNETESLLIDDKTFNQQNRTFSTVELIDSSFFNKKYVRNSKIFVKNKGIK